MQETRKARLASVIREELSMMFRELKDPRIPSLLTITNVDVVDDGSQATVYVSILGIENEDQEVGSEKMENCIEGLGSAAGLLRRHLAKVLTIRHIPNLIFREDKGLRNSARVFDLLKQIGPIDGSTPGDVGSLGGTHPAASKKAAKADSDSSDES